MKHQLVMMQLLKQVSLKYEKVSLRLHFFKQLMELMVVISDAKIENLLLFEINDLLNPKILRILPLNPPLLLQTA